MDRLNAGTASALAENARCEPPEIPPSDLLASDPQQPSLQERMARIVRTIEADIIPRLVRSHREPEGAGADAVSPALHRTDVLRFVAQVLDPSDAPVAHTIARLREQGARVDALYLDLLAPAARELGRMWEEDECVFSDVTVGVGRLQRIMRSLSPAFGTEVDMPADGRRVLLLPAPGEQHTFGLSMVGEFFRRAGWDVVCEFDPGADDPVTLVGGEWFDVLGFSVGVDARLDWLKSRISAVRHASRNRAIGVMVGGPVFAAEPARASSVGADATARDGRMAPVVAEQLLNERARRL